MDIADLLECSICLEQLSHLNKVLPCQHTFCTQCLKDIFQKKQELECPECRKKVPVPIESLPPNILANRILESMGQQARKSSQSSISVPTPSSTSQNPAILTSTQYEPPVLPVPKKPPNNLFNHDNFTKPVRAPVVSHQIMSPTSVGHNMKVDIGVSPNTSPVKQSVTQSSLMSSSSMLSPCDSSIPGNPQTNPFLQLIDATPFYEQQKDNLSHSFSKMYVQPEQRREGISDHLSITSIPAPTVPPPRPPASQSSSPGPPLPDRNKPKASTVDGKKSSATLAASSVSDSTKQWQLSPRAFLDPPIAVTTSSSPASTPSSLSTGATSSSSVASQTIYKAQFEYKATQKDELSLRKGELYQVSEKCHDGWFKGKSVKTGKTGVFPGNYVKEYSGKQAKKSRRKELVSVGEGNLIDLSDDDQKKVFVEAEGDTETDAERLKKLKAIRETLRQAQQQQREQTCASKNKGEKYRCVVPFPASSEFEIDLSIGDVVTLVKRREDGWCKGTHHRTGKTGLFPVSFVEKI